MLVTPCQKVCKLNPKTNICIGCGRTLEEITNWFNYTDEQRLIVLDRLYNETNYVHIHKLK